MSNSANQAGDQLASLGTKKPDIAILLDEYRRSTSDGGFLNRATALDDIRFARWEGQSDDGKKYSENRPEGSPAIPFEGASDARIRMADSICNDLSALLISTFSRAELKAAGIELSDAPQATAATALLRYFRDGKLRCELLEEATLASQWGNQYGWTVFFVGWDQRETERIKTVTMEQLLELSASAPPESIIADLPALINNPEQDEQTATILGGFLGEANKPSELKRFIKELRENGTGEIKERYICRNLPLVQALKPYEDVFFPPETTNLQSARVIFRRCWMTEVELRSKVITEGWSKSWVDNVVSRLAGNSADIFTQAASTTVTASTIERANLAEVVYAYTRTLSESGSPVITYTVFSPNNGQRLEDDQDNYAIHEVLGYSHNLYPFVPFRREVVRRALADSRGVPEILMTDQAEVKAQHDSIRDRTSFETCPPIKVNKRIGSITKVGPFVHIPVTQNTDYEFMEPPAREPSIAFNLIGRVEKSACNYFGLSHIEIDPVKTQMVQQQLVNYWLSSWTEVFRQILSLALQYMDPAEIERITKVPIDAQADQFDIFVKFDVRDLSDDFVTKKLEAISKFIVPLDRSGRVDFSKLTDFLMTAVVPEVARDLLVDAGAASQKMYEGVQNDVTKMLNGIQPIPVENDATAQTKLQMVQDVISKNPKAQKAIQEDQVFAQLLESYAKNLQMSVMQQQNAQIGRLGTDAPEFAQ